MGACSFITKSTGNGMREAYQNAVKQAEYEYGHDAYNGTISTTRGVKDMTQRFHATGISLEKFMEISFDDTEKWGPAFGVRIGDTYHFWGTAAE